MAICVDHYHTPSSLIPQSITNPPATARRRVHFIYLTAREEGEDPLLWRKITIVDYIAINRNSTDCHLQRFA